MGTGAPRPARRRAPISSGPVVVHAVDRGVGGPGVGQLRERKATPGLCLQDLGWVLPSVPEQRPVGHLAAALGLLGRQSGKTKAAARAEAPCGVRPQERALEERSVRGGPPGAPRGGVVGEGGSAERKEHYPSAPHNAKPRPCPPPPLAHPPLPQAAALRWGPRPALASLPAAKRAAGGASEAPSPPESSGTFAPSREKELIINH